MPLNTDGRITGAGHGFLVGEVINPLFLPIFPEKPHTFLIAL